MKTRLLYLASLICILFICVINSFAEDITITTYYPSPAGSYNQLLTNSLGVGDNNGSGTLTSADVPNTTGEVWIKGNVGIGTVTPQSKLQVVGNYIQIPQVSNAVPPTGDCSDATGGRMIAYRSTSGGNDPDVAVYACLKYNTGAKWVKQSGPCLRRSFDAASGNMECPVGYAISMAPVTPSATAGNYLCCPYCNDADNDGVCD